MNRPLAVGLGVLLSACALGLAGWFLHRVQNQLRQTSHQLLETQGSLAQSQESATMLEQEHGKLSKAYDTLKGQLTDANRQLKDATQQSATMHAELEQLSRAREDLERQLEAAQRQQTLLKEEAKALYQEIADTEVGKAALEEKLQHELERSRQLEAITRRAEERAGEEARLRGQMEELSRAYEQLAKAQQAKAVAALSAPPGMTGGGPGALGPAEAPIREQTPVSAPTEALRPHTPDRHELAVRYREAGDRHLANQDYRKAAMAFEKSLAFEDNPMVHTKLEFLYKRLIPDERLAKRHATLASAGRQPLSGLEDSARAHGMPRSGRRLLWDWLTGK
jgi:myosin heavy subunit